MKKQHGDDGPSDPITALTLTFPNDRILVQEEDEAGVSQQKSSEIKSQEERIKEWRGGGLKKGVHNKIADSSTF